MSHYLLSIVLHYEIYHYRVLWGLGVVAKDSNDKRETTLNKKLKDLTGSEFAILSILLIFIVWIGVYPNTFLSLTENSVQMVLTRLGV